MIARIFRPAKTAMQSGRGKTGRWLLVHDAVEASSIEPLMGYTSSGDMNRQIRLVFDSREEAVAYAERKGLAYEVETEHERGAKVMAYSDNFSAGRPVPWTH